MNLRLPAEKLAGVYHFGRFIDKARLQIAGELPEDYQASFCNPAGLDGLFCKAFQLEAQTLVEKIASIEDEQEIVAWFESQTTESQREKWNDFAIELGRPGTALGERFKQVRSTKYPNLPHNWEGTVFEAIALDEAK